MQKILALLVTVVTILQLACATESLTSLSLPACAVSPAVFEPQSLLMRTQVAMLGCRAGSLNMRLHR